TAAISTPSYGCAWCAARKAAKCLRKTAANGSLARSVGHICRASGASSVGSLDIEASVTRQSISSRVGSLTTSAIGVGMRASRLGFRYRMALEVREVLREIADRVAEEESRKDVDLKVGYQGEPGAYGEVAAAAHGGIPQGFASFEKLL